MRRHGIYLMVCMAALCAGGYVGAAGEAEPDDDNKFSVHGEVRFRAEMWDNMMDFTDKNEDLGGDAADDNFDIWPYRYRVMAKGDLGHDVWVGVEFQGTGVAGGGPFGANTSPFGDADEIAESGVSIYQGNIKLVDVGNTVLDLTMGRTELVLDRGLHFSNLPFYNGITHDGAIGAWQWEKFGLTGFWLRNSEANVEGVITSNCGGTIPGTLCEDPDFDTDTIGIHAKHFIGGDEHHDIAYYLFVQEQDSANLEDTDGPGPDTTAETGQIVTLGARWGRYVEDESGWHWNAEVSVQSGDYQPLVPGMILMPNVWGVVGFALPGLQESCTPGSAGDACDAAGMVFEGSTGYTWHGDTSHTIWAGVTVASGDDDPNDEDQDAYMPLYTDFHKRLGYADLWALSNIQAISVGYKAMIGEKHLVGATIYSFSKAEEDGLSFSPLTGGGGAFIDCDPAVVPAGEECEDDLGSEVDIFYNYYMTNNFSFDTALSFVSPGDAVEDHFCGFGACTDDEGSDSAFRITGQARARF